MGIKIRPLRPRSRLHTSILQKIFGGRTAARERRREGGGRRRVWRRHRSGALGALARSTRALKKDGREKREGIFKLGGGRTIVVGESPSVPLLGVEGRRDRWRSSGGTTSMRLRCERMKTSWKDTKSGNGKWKTEGLGCIFRAKEWWIDLFGDVDRWMETLKKCSTVSDGRVKLEMEKHRMRRERRAQSCAVTLSISYHFPLKRQNGSLKMFPGRWNSGVVQSGASAWDTPGAVQHGSKLRDKKKRIFVQK